MENKMKWQPDLDAITIRKVREMPRTIYHPPLCGTWEQARAWVIEQKRIALRLAQIEFDHACDIPLEPE